MKFQFVDKDIVMEGMTNPTVVGRRGPLLCSYVGSVEVVDGRIWTDSEDWEYVTNLYLAVQLPNGPIVGLKDDGTIFALNRRHQLYEIHWGYYPDGFPKEQKTKRQVPKEFQPKIVTCATAAGITELDELPF